MLKWLEVTKSTIQITTYASYQGTVERVIVPYFRKRGIKLVDLKATDLQDFYTKQLERVKANSVIHYHANIHKALKYAVKIDLIPTNPADKVERPDVYKRQLWNNAARTPVEFTPLYTSMMVMLVMVTSDKKWGR